ncbi:MAG: helix-turn-helix domain-containing protein [Pseudomonadota bacterium]
MPPFGEKIRALRKDRGVTMKQMAQAIGVSAPYLSALENGKRGQPSWYLVQRIIAYFNIIWDDAEDIVELARLSHPRAVIDTSGLSPRATELANRLADSISRLSDADLQRHLQLLDQADPVDQDPKE